MATYAQRVLAAATLMKSGQSTGTNHGLVCLAYEATDLVGVHDPVSTQTVGATVGGWTEYAGTTCCAAYGLPDIP
jgi:hypothetical protein